MSFPKTMIDLFESKIKDACVRLYRLMQVRSWVIPYVKWITGVYILLLILIVIATNLGWKPLLIKIIYRIPAGDKISHFFLLGILSFLLNTGIGGREKGIISNGVFKVSLAVLIVVTIEEFSQIFIKWREFSLIDLLFGYAGIIGFGILAGRLTQKHGQLDSGD